MYFLMNVISELLASYSAKHSTIHVWDTELWAFLWYIPGGLRLACLVLKSWFMLCQPVAGALTLLNCTYVLSHVASYLDCYNA